MEGVKVNHVDQSKGPRLHSRLYMQPRGERSVEDNLLDPTRQVHVASLKYSRELGGYHMFGVCREGLDGTHCRKLLWWFIVYKFIVYYYYILQCI